MTPNTNTTSGAADRAIENCPELNMGNYDEVEVERLNDWAIRANDEIDRLHALAAGQATAAQQGAYAALPESFLEIPDVQDESGINAYYSREVVLECIDAALASHEQAPAATTFCWATELAMVREPVTLTVKEAREVSDQMQRLHAASFKTELRNLTSIDLDGDQAVRLAFMSFREASAFKRAVEAHG